MKSSELYVGMEVAVKSREHALGDSIGPHKAIVRQLNAPAEQKKNKATLLDVYDRDGTSKGKYLLSGKNIIGPWAAYSEEVKTKWDAQVFNEARARITREMEQEKRNRQLALINRIYLLLHTVGVTPELRQSAYYRNLSLDPNDNLEVLEGLLSEKIKEKGLNYE